jgi:hypothetical protein
MPRAITKVREDEEDMANCTDLDVKEMSYLTNRLNNNDSILSSESKANENSPYKAINIYKNTIITKTLQSESVFTGRKEELTSYASNYSYESDKRAFLQKISLEHYKDKSYSFKGGFHNYINECKDQLILTHKIYNELKAIPFTGNYLQLNLNPKSNFLLVRFIF